MPAAANSDRLYVSTKNPRSSVCTRGVIRSTSGIASVLKSKGILFKDTQKISAVAAGHRLCQPPHVVRVDVSHAISDLFEARHHQTLPFLDALHEVGGMEKRFIGAGVEPRDASPEPLDVQLAAVQIRLVDIGNFQLSTR